jgi:DNA-binding response OmpR family regulator
MKMAKILVADDNPAILQFLQIALAAEGHEVITAPDGAQALCKARDGRPDLIILDVTMPEVDGFRVLSRIRSEPELRDSVVVMLTGSADPTEMTLGLDIGADFYLLKPAGLTEIRGLVRRLLPRSRPALAMSAA